MRRHLSILGLALLAMCSLTAAAANAETVTLHEKEAAGPEVKVGEELVWNSTNFTFKTEKPEQGNIECSKSVLEGPLTKNKAEPAEGEIKKASFSGEEPEPAKSCHTTITGPLGGKDTVIVTPTGLNWYSAFFANGESLIKSLTKIDFWAYVYEKGKLIARCHYESSLKTTIHDKFEFGVWIDDSLTSQSFVLYEEEPPGSCWREGKLSASYMVSTGKGAAVFATKP